MCNSNFLFSNFFFVLFPFARVTVETEGFANRTVEFPQICSVCLGCVIGLITATTLFPMKSKYSVSGFVFRHGLVRDVMSNVFTQLYCTFYHECVTV